MTLTFLVFWKKSKSWLWLFWDFEKSQSHDFDFLGILKKVKVMTLTFLGFRKKSKSWLWLDLTLWLAEQVCLIQSNAVRRIEHSLRGRKRHWKRITLKNLEFFTRFPCHFYDVFSKTFSMTFFMKIMWDKRIQV